MVGGVSVTPADEARVRIDKWLWAARFFKTRSLASTAVEGGKVQVGGERVKPARALKVGDQLSVRIGPYQWSITVCALSDRRGPAPEARKLYVESEESRVARETLAARIRAERPANPLHRGRPTKKARRELDRLQDVDD
ncbi:MAG: RNA-binding protein [Betaproteobacteria bacterium]|nr:RNA-binding protein [Betaproteobacteria bacterium]